MKIILKCLLGGFVFMVLLSACRSCMRDMGEELKQIAIEDAEHVEPDRSAVISSTKFRVDRGENSKMFTAEHDGHLLIGHISWEGAGGVMHHPDCECLKGGGNHE